MTFASVAFASAGCDPTIGNESFAAFANLTGICPQHAQLQSGSPLWFSGSPKAAGAATAAALSDVILFFHGAGGQGQSWFQKAENMLFASEMAGRYALAALSSVDRAEKKWSNRPSAQNPDYLNVVAALARLEQSGLVAANARVYLVGMSQGCGFVSLLSQLLRLHASRPPYAQLMACCTGFDSTSSSIPSTSGRRPSSRPCATTS